ncbi:MAG: hypothetical protein A2166_03045 [Omnitrophica WOR_2 bacterium RBG_13_41_10]|nr:MAG: hypothetical protein A2166_03045 [Omnitrophica WOR_2 bacterium RBG_13_41_10]
MERKKTISIILLAFLLYFPFIFLGPGSSECSWFLINTAKTLIQQHKYVPSRYPGNVVHELATTLLFIIGGSVLTNLGTLVMSLLTIYFFIKICEYHNIPHKYLLAIFMAINPVYYVASTFTMDNLWALGFLFIGYTMLIKKKYFITVIFWALAIGTRISSILFIAVLLFAYFLTKEPDKNKVLVSVSISAIIGASFYILPFLHASCTFGFFRHFAGPWNWWGHFARFVYKNIYFWGLQTVLTFLLLLFLIIKSLKRNYELRYKNVIVTSILMILVFEIMYLEIPAHRLYLLPVLPFALMLLGIALKKYRSLIILLIIVQFSYNFININIAKPDVPNNATTFTIGLWFERGYLINDIIERIRMNQESLICK